MLPDLRRPLLFATGFFISIVGGTAQTWAATEAAPGGWHESLWPLLDWIAAQGWLGALTLLLLYALACLTFLPGSLLTLGAGAIYGLWLGVLLISAGSLLGSALAFFTARYLFRDWIYQRLAKNPKFLALDSAVAKEGWKIVLLSRLSPIFPFSLLNYGLGLTRISWSHFLLASWIGTLPLITVYVYAGMLAGGWARIDNSGVAKDSPAAWTLKIIGLIATIVLSLYLTRLATRTLREKLDAP